MSGSKKYFWLKLPENFFKEKEMKKLRRIAGGDTYTVIYLKMALLSLENEGKIYFDGIEETFEEELALDLDEELENVKVVVGYLKGCFMLEVISKNEYFLNRVPEMTGKETESARKMRKLRHRQKKLGHNVTTTLPIVTKALPDVRKSDIEIEKEIEKEKREEIDIEEDPLQTYEQVTNEKPIHQLFALNWYKKLQKTGLLIQPTDKDYQYAFQACNKLGNNQQLLDHVIDDYWLNFTKAWYYAKSGHHSFNSFCANIDCHLPKGPSKEEIRAREKEEKRRIKREVDKKNADFLYQELTKTVEEEENGEDWKPDFSGLKDRFS